MQPSSGPFDRTTFPNLSLGALHLQTLELGENSLHGTIPETLCDNKDLTNMLLTENDLSGTIPSCISALTNLNWLEINGNKLRGPLPDGLCDLAELTELNLYDNSVRCGARAMPSSDAPDPAPPHQPVRGDDPELPLRPDKN